MELHGEQEIMGEKHAACVRMQGIEVEDKTLRRKQILIPRNIFSVIALQKNFCF